jgi:hypothetical protein
MRAMTLASLLVGVPQVLTGCGSGSSSTSGPSGPLQFNGRDPWVQPYIPTSIWNMPIGSGAQYSQATDPETVDLRTGVAVLNSGMWSEAAYLASSKDPMVTVTAQEGTSGSPNEGPWRINANKNMLPDPSSDAHLAIVDPTHSYSTELYGAAINSDGSISAVRGYQVDLYGDGAKLYGSTAVHDLMLLGMGGLIRVAELQSLHIPHATTLVLSLNRAKVGPVWPALADDYCAYQTPSCYSGNVPIGALVAIVPTVDLTTLGLTPAGLAFARCLQDYGAYVNDTGGSDLAFLAEDAAAQMSQLTDIRNDLAKMSPYLAVVTNNTAATIGGGGTPRQPLAPPLGTPN